MKARMYGSIVSAAVLAGGILFLPAAPATAQGPGGGRGGRGGPRDNAPTGPVPMTDGHPDFSGYWERPYTPDMSAIATDMNGKPLPLEDPMHRGQELKEDPNAKQGGRGGFARRARLLPYTDWGRNNWATYDPTNGDYTGACFPFGLMRSINSPDPLQIIQHGSYLAELFEQNTWFHVFHIDNRPHNPKGVPTWFGDSQGHWEGNTLVVETTNFNGHTRLDTNGHPHSNKLVLTERWTRTDLGHIDYVMAIHDPKTYTEDWKTDRTFTLNPKQEIMEYSCEENNKALYEGRIKAPKFDDDDNN